MALQALFMLNDPFLHEQADGLAERVLREHASDEERIDLVFALTIGRPPSEQERAQSLRFFAQYRDAFTASQSGDEASHAAWRSYVRAILRMNEFLYID